MPMPLLFWPTTLSLARRFERGHNQSQTALRSLVESARIQAGQRRKPLSNLFARAFLWRPQLIRDSHGERLYDSLHA